MGPKEIYCLNDSEARERYRPLEENFEVEPYKSMNSLRNEVPCEMQSINNSYNSLCGSVHQPSDAHGSMSEPLNKAPTTQLAGDRNRSPSLHSDSLHSFETRSHSNEHTELHGTLFMRNTEEFELAGMRDRRQPSSNIGVEPESFNNDAHQNSMNPSLRSGPNSLSYAGPFAEASQSSGQNLSDKMVARNHSAVMGTVKENNPAHITAPNNYESQRGPLSIRNDQLNKADIPNKSVTTTELISSHNSTHSIQNARPNEFEQKLNENPPYRGAPSVVITQTTPGTTPNEYGSQVTRQGPPGSFSESQGTTYVNPVAQQGFPSNSYQGVRAQPHNDRNIVNYSVTSQHNSLDQTVGQSSAHSNQQMMMPNHSGEVLQANKQSMWSMENRRMNEQNASLNCSVGAPHSSQMPADLDSDQENQDEAITTPSQSKNQGRQNAPPAADQTRGSAHRNLVGPHGFVQDAHQHESLVNQSANMLNVQQHTGNGGISIQARDNHDNPSHLPSQSNQFIIPSHQQHPRQQSNPPGQYGNPPEQQQNIPMRQYANPPRQFNSLPGQSYATGRQFNQPMDLNHKQSQTSDGRQQRRGKKVYHQNYDGSSTQAQPTSHEAGQGRIVTHNYSGVQNPGVGNDSLMSLHSGQFNSGSIPQPPSFINPVMNQTGLASSQHTPVVYHQNCDGTSTQAQLMSQKANQGCIVTHNYSGVQNPGTGSSSLMSLRNKRLNEQSQGNNFGLQSLKEEEAQGYVVMYNYGGQLNRDVPETENPFSLCNKKLSDQNAVNYSVTSQHNSLDQTIVQSRAHSSGWLVVPNESGQPSSLDQTDTHGNQGICTIYFTTIRLVLGQVTKDLSRSILSANQVTQGSVHQASDALGKLIRNNYKAH